MLLLVVIVLFVIFITSLVIYARWNYGTLEAMGIPVIKPFFILGSTPDLHRKVAHFEDIERFKKYGSVYGVSQKLKPCSSSQQ
jgi:hypothetical protein